MTQLTVRRALLSDLGPLAMLFDRYRQFQGQPSDLSAARRFLLDRFDHGDSVIFLAFDGETAVGFAQLYPSFSSVSLSRVFILNDLYVDESSRRKGAASKLMIALEELAWCLGATRVTLNVARDNATAQALYASRGWKQDEHFFMFHRHPESIARS